MGTEMERPEGSRQLSRRPGALEKQILCSSIAQRMGFREEYPAETVHKLERLVPLVPLKNR